MVVRDIWSQGSDPVLIHVKYMFQSFELAWDMGLIPGSEKKKKTNPSVVQWINSEVSCGTESKFLQAILLVLLMKQCPTLSWGVLMPPKVILKMNSCIQIFVLGLL